jgi:hypothetical protein
MKWIVRDMDGDIVETLNSLKEARNRARDITGSTRATESKGNCFYYFRSPKSKDEMREIYVIREDCMKQYWGE